MITAELVKQLREKTEQWTIIISFFTLRRSSLQIL